ncbi:MAG: ribosome-binding factor A, partial [Methylobacteriaceae bacterium]|nr:ribosome-binding factor A [Methylobacteriaceae bacterium]
LATIFVMPLGGKDGKAVVEALDRHKKELRAEIARKVNLKYAADIRFRMDNSFDEAARIDALLRTSSARAPERAAAPGMPKDKSPA